MIVKFFLEMNKKPPFLRAEFFFEKFAHLKKCPLEIIKSSATNDRVRNLAVAFESGINVLQPKGVKTVLATTV